MRRPEDDSAGKWADLEDSRVEEEEDRTPSRSPTPRREIRSHEEEDEEDARLEAALRGEFKEGESLHSLGNCCRKSRANK